MNTFRLIVLAEISTLNLGMVLGSWSNKLNGLTIWSFLFSLGFFFSKFTFIFGEGCGASDLGGAGFAVVRGLRVMCGECFFDKLIG